MTPLPFCVPLAAGLSVIATLHAQSPKANGAGHAAAAPSAHTPIPAASANANAVQAVLQKFDASRDQLVAARQALIDQLATASNPAERAMILAQLHDEQKSMQDAQRDTAKEIRAELQNLRRQRASGG